MNNYCVAFSSINVRYYQKSPLTDERIKFGKRNVTSTSVEMYGNKEVQLNPPALQHEPKGGINNVMDRFWRGCKSGEIE